MKFVGDLFFTILFIIKSEFYFQCNLFLKKHTNDNDNSHITAILK